MQDNREIEKRELNITFNKGGSGSIGASTRLPISWIKSMGLGVDDRRITVEFDGETIVIKKAK